MARAAIATADAAIRKRRAFMVPPPHCSATGGRRSPGPSIGINQWALDGGPYPGPSHPMIVGDRVGVRQLGWLVSHPLSIPSPTQGLGPPAPTLRCGLTGVGAALGPPHLEQRNQDCTRLARATAVFRVFWRSAGQRPHRRQPQPDLLTEVGKRIGLRATEEMAWTRSRVSADLGRSRDTPSAW